VTSRKLAPLRHTNRDFFACDIFDVLPFFKDDLASMEHPIFSLSTKPDMRHLIYEHNGNRLEIKPGADGLPTIHDKDVLIYCASQLRAAMLDGHEPKQRVRFTAYDFFISTNRHTDGRYYANFQKSLERLAGTRLQTNIKTGDVWIAEGFGVIDAWKAVKEDPNGRPLAVEIKLSDWTYNGILANELLTIDRDYFRLRRPLDRRLYELGRKHCGDQESWKVSLSTLHKKIGTTASKAKLRMNLRQVIETNHLPDYSVSMEDDLVTFANRNRRPQNVTARSRDTIPPLPTSIYEKAKQAAPGYDVHALEAEWRLWSKGPVQNPAGAFLGFCKRVWRRQPLR
jgi:plasmid replication initiation protein